MAVVRKVIIRSADNLVVNIVSVDDTSTWQAPAGHFTMDDDGTGSIGWTWNGSIFVPPPAPPAAEGPFFHVQAGDAATSSNLLIDVPGFAIQVWPQRTYLFDCLLWWRSAATSTGVLFTATGPASPVGFDMAVETQLTLTTMNIQRVTAYDGGVPTGSIDAANADRLCRISGMLITGPTAGVLQLRARSEINNSQVTLRAGSRARVHVT